MLDKHYCMVNYWPPGLINPLFTNSLHVFPIAIYRIVTKNIADYNQIYTIQVHDIAI